MEKWSTPCFFMVFSFMYIIWVLMTLKVTFGLYLCNIALWYIFPVKDHLSNWHCSVGIFCCHLHQHQYFILFPISWKTFFLLHVLLTALGKWNEVGRSYFYGIVYWPVAHNSKCYKDVCQFIWLYMYDSYKHHSKYTLDNYRINVLLLGVIFLWYSILTRGS